MNDIRIVKTALIDIMDVVRAHIGTLTFPLDSYLEDALMAGDCCCFECGGRRVGYCVIEGDALQFFYVLPKAYRYAPVLLERVVDEYGIKKALVMSQDSQMCALMAEWDFDKARFACWFTDSGVDINHTPPQGAVFRLALEDDAVRIRGVCGDFFDETSGGFETLEQRIDAGTIFVLEQGDLMGVGIVEPGQICTDYASIGMFVNPKHRRKGAATTILMNLKQWAKRNGLVPVAGCWYYNTLSRMSLESAGMIATSMGFEAILKQKDKPPRRTGNPPGELVE